MEESFRCPSEMVPEWRNPTGDLPGGFDRVQRIWSQGESVIGMGCPAVPFWFGCAVIRVVLFVMNLVTFYAETLSQR